MVLFQKGQAWRLLFAAFLGSTFVGYCIFWSHVFFEFDETRPTEDASRCGTCKDLASDFFSDEEGKPLPGGFSSRTSGRDGTGIRARYSVAASRRHRLLKVQDPALRGPYSLAVQEGLRGVLLPGHGKDVLGSGLKLAGSLEASSSSQATPSIPPVYGYVTSGFGVRESPFHGQLVQHRGIDFSVPYGAQVFATADGEVVFAGWLGGLGRTISIDHGHGVLTRYAHASHLLAAEGDVVRRGEVIALAGNSGRSTGTHLHYEVWTEGKAIDPMPFLSGDGELKMVAQTEVSPERENPSEPGLGLAMGGDGVGLSEAPWRQIPRYDGRRTIKFNLLTLGSFVALGVFLIGRLYRSKILSSLDLEGPRFWGTKTD